MAVGDIYELVDAQKLFNQDVLNVYYYEQIAILVVTEPDTIAKVLANKWIDDVLDKIRTSQSGDITHVSVKTRNLFDDADTAEVLISLPGLFNLAADDTDSAFVAAGYKESTTNGGIRPGSKRIAAIPSNMSVDGVVVSSEYLTQAATTTDALTDNVLSDTLIPVDTWRPVVVKRVKETIAGKVKYRLPNVIGEKVIGVIVSALFNAVLTSQVSRKVGNGS